MADVACAALGCKEQSILKRIFPHSTCDRYLLSQLVVPFVVSLGAVLVVLSLQRLLVLFDDLAAQSSSIATLVSLLTDLLPHYLGLALPAALCVSVFLIVRRMSDHNEIDALMAGGISLSRIARPYMWVGVLLGGASILLYGYIQPVARYDFRSSFYDAAHSGWAPHLQAGMFATADDNAMLTSDGVSHNGTQLHRIFIRQQVGVEGERITTARRGLITVNPSTRTTRLDLWNGEITFITPDKQAKVTETRFEHSIRLFSAGASRATFRSRGADERELTLFELAARLQASHQSASQIPDKTAPHQMTRSSLRAELDFRLARALAVPFIPPLAVAFAIGGKRRRPVFGVIFLAIILVGFDHVLQFGHGLISTGKMRGFYAIWLPEFFFCLGCTCVLFRRSRGAWRRQRAKRHQPDFGAIP